MLCAFPTRGHDASQITLALGTAASYPRACQALGAMLSRGALNPADITVLFKMFTSMDPPPVELVSCLRSSEAGAPRGRGGGGAPTSFILLRPCVMIFVEIVCFDAVRHKVSPSGPGWSQTEPAVLP